MLSQSYAIEQFRSNFLEKQTMKQLKALFQDPKIDLSVAIRATQIDTNWSAKADIFTGSSKILLLPRLYLSGEVYEAKCWQELSPSGFADFEPAFLKALKESIASVQLTK